MSRTTEIHSVKDARLCDDLEHRLIVQVEKLEMTPANITGRGLITPADQRIDEFGPFVFSHCADGQSDCAVVTHSNKAIKNESSMLLVPKFVIDFKAGRTRPISDNVAILKSLRAVWYRSHSS